MHTQTHLRALNENSHSSATRLQLAFQLANFAAPKVATFGALTSKLVVTLATRHSTQASETISSSSLKLKLEAQAQGKDK